MDVWQGQERIKNEYILDIVELTLTEKNQVHKLTSIGHLQRSLADVTVKKNDTMTVTENPRGGTNLE